jgi:colanic acid biosynthesis glycosyl transferase WcaI
LPSVLFINRVYPPDEGATGQLLAELAAALIKEGWNVTVLASGNSKLETQNPKLPIHRVRGLPFTRASLLRRALSYATLYPALLGRALRLPRHDVVVTLTDPPLLLVLGPFFKFFQRSRLVHWAQDLYPEVAEELGVLRKGGLAAGVARAFSNWALRRHDRVIAVGHCMKQRLLARGLSDSRIEVIPNWAVGFTTPACAQSSTLNSQLTVLYSGNFGLAHPFESIVEAVKLLHRESAPLRFVFAGAGPRLNALREQTAGCGNVEFREPVALEDLPASLAEADVHLVCMSEELLGLVVPSKIYGALASRRPCVFLGPRESEAARSLSASGRGCVLNPRGSGRALAELLARWAKRDPEYDAMRSVCENFPIPTLPLAAFQQALRP